MHERALDAMLGRTVAVDSCDACHCFWFDGHESLQLAPAAVLQLFATIGERKARPSIVDSASIKCPRCQARLRRTTDVQRSTRFEYFKCPHDHGRLISFFDFLKTKDFIKPLTPKQLQELRQQVQTVNCHNCGAAIDLATNSTCSHCGTPLSLWDMTHADVAVERLRDAARSEDSDSDAGDKWVEAWNSAWLHEAQLIKSVLEAEGIEVQIPDEHFVGVQPLYATAIGGIRVLVRSSDAARAAEVLGAVDSD